MARGPKKKSAAIDRQQGNPSHRKAKDEAPAPIVASVEAEDVSAIAAPAWIGESGKRYWREVAEGLKRQGLLRQVDAIALARYCLFLSRFIELEKSLRRKKLVNETTSKFVKMQRTDKNFQALLAIDAKLSAFEDRFGMNPRERTAIQARIASESALPPSPGPASDASKDTVRPLVGPSTPRSPVGILGGGRLN